MSLCLNVVHGAQNRGVNRLGCSPSVNLVFIDNCMGLGGQHFMVGLLQMWCSIY